MPARLIYSDIVCWSTYLISAGVGTFFAEQVASFFATLITLSLCSILVFYVKKWLEREDKKINKNGGLISFIKAYLKKNYNNNCKDKCE